MNCGIRIKIGLNRFIMQGSWITKETENIYKTDIYKWFKEKYSLIEGIQIWDSKKVPFLFNDRVALAFYIERGYLDFIIYDLKKNKWFRSSLASIEGLEDFNFKSYFEKIKDKVRIDEIGSLESTQKLHYYIHLIDENLAKMILEGNFNKLKKNMEDLDNNQIKDITEMVNSAKM